MMSKEKKIKVKWAIIGLLSGLLLGLIGLFFQRNTFIEHKSEQEKIKAYCYNKATEGHLTNNEELGIYMECLRDFGGEF